MKKTTILVIEDDSDEVGELRRAILGIASSLRFTFIPIHDVVDYFESGSAEQAGVRAVLLDVTIPCGLGLWAMRWFTSSSQLRQLPLFALTGSDTQEREAIGLGAREVFVKSSQIADLQRILKAIEQEMRDRPAPSKDG